MTHRQAHCGRHVLPGDFDETGRRRSVSRQAHPDDRGASRVERLAERTQAVRRVRHAVQQQDAGLRRSRCQLETAVPVRRPAFRIGQAVAVVAVDRAFPARRHLGIDLRVQLCEEPVFERQVVGEAIHSGGLGELLVEVRQVPDVEFRSGLQVDHANDHQRHNGPANAVGHGDKYSPGKPGQAQDHRLLPRCALVERGILDETLRAGCGRAAFPTPPSASRTAARKHVVAGLIMFHTACTTAPTLRRVAQETASSARRGGGRT